MFHIKICGVRLKEDVDASADAHADAIGLNFYPRSVRFVDPADLKTQQLAQHAAERNLIRVGVFVNEPVESILEIAERLTLDVVQLHGDEPIEAAKQLIRKGKRVLRAIKLPAGDLTVDEVESRTSMWRKAGASLLLDADAGSAHGGSGKTLDWNAVREWSCMQTGNDWVLAGGLNPSNVGEAIRTSGATRVDVASGVEASRGVKSKARIQEFVKQASEAMEKN